MILVDLTDVGARRPDRPLFEDLSLTVASGDRLGVVGRNGGGKSTLLRVLAGEAEPEEGTVRRGRGVRVGFLSQRPVLPAGTVGAAVGTHWEAAAILDRLGMAPLVTADVATLSGGQAKRVALARVLVAEVDLLVLDEPTNHLDLDSREALESALQDFPGAVLLVSHDRALLDAVGSRTVAVEDGTLHSYVGGWPEYVRIREEAAAAKLAARNAKPKKTAVARRGTPAATGGNGSGARARTLEAEIERAEAVLAALEAELADPAAWNDPRSAEQSSKRHGQARRALDELYAQWEAVAT